MDAGQVIGGRYECLAPVGRGGMGEVWRARDTLLQRDVAIKRITYADGPQDTAGIARSMREARLAARLNHPNAVAVHDVVTDETGLPCLVMELVEGTSLKELIARSGSLPPGFVARVGRQVASALAAAHRQGIVHRDVKPANVLIADDGTAKLTDFGIARDDADAGLTSTDTFIGTPSFLAPEVALGRKHEPASDVWSLGAVLYDAVEGAAPFAAPGGNALAILNLIATTDPPVPRHAGPLTPVITTLLRRDPAARPPASEVAKRLDELTASPEGFRSHVSAPPQGSPATGPFTPPGPMTPAPGPFTPPPGPFTPPPGPFTPPPGPMTPPPGPYPPSGPFTPPPGPYPPAGYPGPQRRRGRGPLLAVGGAVVVVAALVVTLVLTLGGGKQHEADPTPTPLVTTAARTTSAPATHTTSAPGTASPAGSACDDERTDGFGPAVTYMVDVEFDDVAGAQACTAPGTVADSVTKSLAGKTYTPTYDDLTGGHDTGPTAKYEFDATGVKVIVTCTRGSDGEYLVTDVRKS